MGKVFIAGGGKMNVPSAGVLASSLAVGSIVKLMRNNQPAEFIVVHQGLPDPMYDTSCDGTWLLDRYIYTEEEYNTNFDNAYSGSYIASVLASKYFPKFNDLEKGIIKEVKIPYVAGSGAQGIVNTNEKGLLVKTFLLSAYEVGFDRMIETNMYEDGSKLSFFEYGETTSAKNIRKVVTETGRGVAQKTRSPKRGGNSQIIGISVNGNLNLQGVNLTTAARPALILPSNALFDKETMQLKGIKGGM